MIYTERKHPVDEANEKDETEDAKFRKMLRKHLPGILRELSEVGIISIHDGLKQSSRIRMEIRG